MLQGLQKKASSKTSSQSIWFLYVLQCQDDTFYTGITNNLEKRMKAHNDGKGAKYTRTRRPVTLLYYEKCSDRSAALIREAAVKAMPRKKKESFVGFDETFYGRMGRDFK